MKKWTKLRHYPRIIVVAVMSLTAIGVLAACSATKQVSDVKPVGGFLPQPALLTKGQSGQAALTYRSPQMTSGMYDKVILDPVTLWTGANSPLNNRPAEEQQALAETFHKDVYDAISKECQMVTETGPNTLRIRLALVDAEESYPVLNTISTYIPQAHVVTMLSNYAFNDGTGIFAGSATAEGFAMDSQTGALLWEGVDERAGHNALGTDTLKSWDDVDNAFVAWSEEFRKRLKALGICQH